MFCGVFDGHGRSGHIVSKLVRDYLPSLLLSERNAIVLSDNDDYGFGNCNSSSSCEEAPSPLSSPEMFDEWKQACTNAFRAMDKELKLQNNLDCSFSGTTAVTIIKQVNYRENDVDRMLFLLRIDR